MRLLIYGFGLYGNFQENITETILRSLPKRHGLKTIVFPVRFHRSQFIKAVRDYKPDVVLGLGQCSRGKRLRIETRAVNLRRDGNKDRPRRIVARGAMRLLTTVRLNGAREARPSRDAGRYVCNYSMYVILDYLIHRRAPVGFGFIHIPHDYDPGKARRFLLGAIQQLAEAR